MNIMENGAFTERPKKMTEQKKKKIAKQVNQYLQMRVMPLLGPLQIELLKLRPQNITSFSIEWLKNKKYNRPSAKKIALESDDQPDQIFKQKRRQKLSRRKRSRLGIIGDCQRLTICSSRESYLQNPGVQWSKQVTVALILNLKKCVFFQHLETHKLLRLTKRMRAVKLQAGEVIIKQGDYGNELYVVDSGQLMCKKRDSEKVLKYYTKGEIFGQLSLLYNNPRASTVTAMQKCNLFALSRADFAATTQYGMLQKLKECELLMEKVDIFETLNLYQRSKLYQCMKVKDVAPEKYIIRQGQTADSFYIVAEGQLVAQKKQNGENKLVYTYKKGGYFGELAFLRSAPRQASVKTLTEVRLYYIDAECFARVLGSFEAILKRNEQNYAKITAQLLGTQKLSE